VDKPLLEDEAPDIPSVIGTALRFSLAIAITHSIVLLGLAAFWHSYMPVADPVLRTASSLVLLILPIILLIIYVPRFTAHMLSSVTAITEAVEQVTIGRLNVELPPPVVRESARLSVALTDMLRRLRTSLIQLEKAAQEDSLTHLYNRSHFKSKVEPLLSAKLPCAMLLLDLDRFKAVNESIGHGGGDRLLTLVAERIKVALEKYNAGQAANYAPIIARLSSDEFAICLVNMTESAAIAHVAQRLLKAIDEPFNIDGATIKIGVSIGIALAAQDGDDYELLTRNADLALFHAKHLGKHNFQFFNESLKRQALAKFTIENQLRTAFERDELEVYYQPQLCAKDQSLICFEALVRWRHPTMGLLLPDKFIAIAEEFGLIGEIGQIVLRQSVAQAAIWHQQNRPMRVSVNVAAIQLRTQDFGAHIRALLAEFNLPAWLLELELTETIAMQDTHDVFQQLTELRAMGVSLAIDDFGTGYSNLALLRRLEFDRLKIDRSFISGIEIDENARMIVSTILAMARTMQVEVVAEGIETSRQATILTAAGCAILQGFLYSQALPVAELEAWWDIHTAQYPPTSQIILQRNIKVARTR
jgi:diguanylate cyclase (GGDEF)-like protein